MVRTGIPYAGMKALITKGSCFLKSQIDKLIYSRLDKERSFCSHSVLKVKDHLVIRTATDLYLV